MQQSNVYFFNPTCELAVANGSFSYMPPLLLQEMENDLAMLPFVYASPGDYVLTEQKPSADFLTFLKNAGFVLPDFVKASDLNSKTSYSLNEIRPWGWSPAAHYSLAKLKDQCSEDFKNSPVFNWTNNSKMLYERISSLKLLNKIVSENDVDWMIKKNMTGIVVSSVCEIETYLKTNTPIVLKAPLSSSGRGIQIIRNPDLNNSNRQWIHGVLKQQQYLIVEPFLDKQIDFSFQFNIHSETAVEYLGYSIFETNSNGQYIGTMINPDLSMLLQDLDMHKFNIWLVATEKIIRETLLFSDYVKYHRGFIGVDAMVFKHQEKTLIQPCIEINCRMNMGVLSLHLARMIDTQSSGIFKLFNGKQGDFFKFATEQQKINPLKMKNGKICSGFLQLTEPDSCNKFGAYTVLAVAK